MQTRLEEVANSEPAALGGPKRLHRYKDCLLRPLLLDDISNGWIDALGFKFLIVETDVLGEGVISYHKIELAGPIVDTYLEELEEIGSTDVDLQTGLESNDPWILLCAAKLATDGRAFSELPSSFRPHSFPENFEVDFLIRTLGSAPIEVIT